MSDAPTTSAAAAPADITPELLDTHDAAKLLSIGERTLWRWSRSGICPAPIKIGRGLRAAVRYRRAELLKWISDGCPRAERGQR
ncbi:MAG: helix-turn-helix domain-containing protein [Planctomycetes bacterium]|nr:helix-turn-helix domain-containing protein [Planctomycetota bacterium]